MHDRHHATIINSLRMSAILKSKMAAKITFKKATLYYSLTCRYDKNINLVSKPMF